MLMTNRLGTIDDYLIADDGVHRCLKIIKFRQLVYIELFLFFVYYCLHTFYEQKKNIKIRFFYLKKMIKVGFHELAPISSNLLYDGQESLVSYFHSF